MTKAMDLSALFADTELPFGHPGRNFDESPAGYSDFHDRYEPPPIDPPEEEIIHYGPGDSPLCDNDCANAVYTDDPPEWPATPTVWSWWRKTCRTRTTTWDTAGTAAKRSPPPESSNGGAWSAAHALTAGERDGQHDHLTGQLGRSEVKGTRT